MDIFLLAVSAVIVGNISTILLFKLLKFLGFCVHSLAKNY